MSSEKVIAWWKEKIGVSKQQKLQSENGKLSRWICEQVYL